jgi:hypothetical protein
VRVVIEADVVALLQAIAEAKATLRRLGDAQ